MAKFIHTWQSINVNCPHQNDEAPSNAEIRDAVKACRNGRAGGGSKMKAKDVKEWLRKAELEETQEGFVGAGDTWRLEVKLIYHIWEMGEILRQIL